MTEATMALMAEPFLEYFATGVEPQARGNHVDGCAPHNTYHCADGGWVAVAAHDDREWQALCSAIGAPERLAALTSLAERVAARAEIDGVIGEWCGSRPRDEAAGLLRRSGVCCAPVRRFDELVGDDHVTAHGLVTELMNEGVGRYHVVKLPWQATPPADLRYTPAPRLGQDNDYVFKQILELSDEQIAALTEANALV
jgi:benzylsuccinate CoA-transferase BbsF subunit